MSVRIALIHGYAMGLTAHVLRPPFGPEAGFLALRDEVHQGEAAVFSWGIREHVSWVQLLNPFFLYAFYKREAAIAREVSTQERLHHFLAEKQPEMIVCHSMGCALLMAHLAQFSIPSSVQRIVFVQADLPRQPSFLSTIPVENFYCPWDPTLWMSSILNGSRAGLRPLRGQNVTNHLFPLWRPINLHTSSIRDPKLRFVLKRLSASF